MASGMWRRGRLALAAAVCAVLAAGSGCGAGTAADGQELTAGADPGGGGEFGLATDPWQVDDWADAVGARPTMVMAFEQWHQQRTIDDHLAEAQRRGLRSFMVTWEPWESVPAELGREAQYADQPRWNNASIADGDHDDYIRAFAESVAAVDLTVYIRHAHEMNGDWYPWSRDPDSYVAAWRRIVDLFREAGADNAQFVFSLNASLYQDPDEWREDAQPYWPGDDYVDLLGSTMINFGGSKEYSVDDFAERLELMRDTFDRDLLISELNTSYEGRVAWLADLRTWLSTEAHWVTGVVLSQGESRGEAQLGSEVGNLSWNVVADPETQPVIRGMVEDLTTAGGQD